MNREQLQNRLSSRIQTVRLDDETEVKIRPLSALDRARIYDNYAKLESEGAEKTLESVTEAQCFIVSRSAVNDSGCLLYQDGAKVDAELYWKDIQTLYLKILEISGMTAKTDPEKNLPPTPNADSSSVSD